MKIVTSDQMRRIEERSERAGVSTDALMERAGLEFARRVRHHIGHLVGVPVVVLVGPGNNGADGLVAARHLHNWGAKVLAYLCRDRPKLDPKLDLVRALDIPVLKSSEDADLGVLDEVLASAHLVMDALLGTGRSRPIEGELKAVLARLGRSKVERPALKILALDLPTGLDADTGAVDAACVGADITVALGYPKVGLLHHQGSTSVGSLETVDIGIPPGLDTDVDLELMTHAWAASKLPARPTASHKGSYGRTLVVAGSRSFVGAAHLASAAAVRSGAGLVTVAIPESLQAAVASLAPEPTFLPLPESAPGVVSAEAASVILEGIGSYDALLIGCGLGQAAPTREAFAQLVLSGAPLPATVIDADGLNILSETPHWWEKLEALAIVTPHPGEMGRLTGQSTEAVQRDRIAVARDSARQWNKVVVLKGAYTVVALPDGRAMLSPFANPALASAGTGDVLAGAVAGLLSQAVPAAEAAALGVYLHGIAGELVRKELGDAGLAAADLLPALPRAIQELRAKD
ncbi:MAG: NAD(P)H-hydrate dehydratase [Chloroflexi bacterium]|nr:NAD(P)H-hydrate dehydratase [Chloroflexota bacterium]